MRCISCIHKQDVHLKTRVATSPSSNGSVPAVFYALHCTPFSQNSSGDVEGGSYPEDVGSPLLPTRGCRSGYAWNALLLSGGCNTPSGALCLLRNTQKNPQGTDCHLPKGHWLILWQVQGSRQDLLCLAKAKHIPRRVWTLMHVARYLLRSWVRPGPQCAHSSRQGPPHSFRAKKKWASPLFSVLRMVYKRLDVITCDHTHKRRKFCSLTDITFIFCSTNKTDRSYVSPDIMMDSWKKTNQGPNPNQLSSDNAAAL